MADAPPLPALPTGPLPSGLVTFMFTDIVNSTKLKSLMPGETSGERQDAFHHRIKLLHSRLIFTHVARHGGIIVEGTGDGYFIVFTDAEQAVLCAVEIQSSMAKAPVNTPLGPVQIRIGLHTGQAKATATGYTSSAADKAARVQSRAEPGQVLLSSETRELIRHQLPSLATHSVGEQELKGLGAFELFAVTRAGATATPPSPLSAPLVPAAAPSAPAAPAPPPAKPAIRVLVAGSLSAPKNKAERAAFTTVCQRLGAALAQRGVTIVVSSLHKFTADLPVLQGANDSRQGKQPLGIVLLPPTIGRPNDPLMPGNEAEFHTLFPNLTHSLEVLPGNWKAVRATQATEADLVILIGGREGASQLGWAAKRAGVPLLPIPIFGRAAGKLWEVELNEHSSAKRYDLAEAFDRLYKKFKADEVADLALLLAKRRPTKA